MKLGFDYVLYSSIILVMVVPMYIYRKKIFTFAYKTDGFSEFVKELKIYLKRTYPKFNFNFSIITRTADQKDIRVRQSLIVENIISQLIEFEFSPDTQDPIAKDKLWIGYDEYSKPAARKPGDWKKRRNIVWQRDKKSCVRCSKPVKFDEATTSYVTDTEIGGGFNVENLFTICRDCNLILNKDDTSIKFRASNLDVYDHLYALVDKF